MLGKLCKYYCIGIGNLFRCFICSFQFSRCGFGLLMYGFGSKKALIEDFASTALTEYSVVVINGYLQAISIKQVSFAQIQFWSDTDCYLIAVSICRHKTMSYNSTGTTSSHYYGMEGKVVGSRPTRRVCLLPIKKSICRHKFNKSCFHYWIANRTQ